MANGLETDLRQLIAARRLLVVVGSGVSIAATNSAPAASWPGLLKLGVARCRELDPTLDPAWEQRVLGEIASNDLDDMLSAAEKISRKLQAPDGPNFTRWLRETVGALPLSDRAVLEALRDLHLPLVTTNYDHLLETVTGLPSATWRDQNQVFRVLRGEEQAILHVHGHWAQPDSVVLGIRAYEAVRQDAHEQAVIRALAMTHSLLFVGCGDTLTDPNFKPFLSWLRGVNAHNEAHHYRLALKSEVKKLQAQHPPEERIFVLPYGQQHADLAGFLRGLAPAKVEPLPPPPVTPDTAAAPPASPKRLPPGLRAFTADDHEWFLCLLPGPKDDGGLPASLRFWKTRLEQGDPRRTFKVGLLHGRSGCGKSSLIKAGLIPALAKQVVLPVYEQATPETESTLAALQRELLNALKKDESLRAALASLPADQTLRQLLTSLRDRPELTGGRKVVLLLDQFEQWLNAHRQDAHGELAATLRLCDGGRLQAVLLVRSEFLDAAQYFIESLGVQIRTYDDSGHDNTARAELFEPEHAQRVLREYGRAYERFGPSGIPGAAQEEFIAEVVRKLAEARENAGKVVCVHLALLAKLLEHRPWTPDTLKTLGGVERVGYHFLKENFDGDTAYRRYRLPAMAVLEVLLPKSGGDIRGRSRSEAALRAATVQADSKVDFTRLLQILNDELRLVTPTELVPADGPATAPPSPVDAAEKRYQLTHDYLVPSLRDWLTEKQRETVAGRASLALETRAAQWQDERKLRFLPTLPEYVRILCFAPRRRWDDVQRTMFRAASVFYAVGLAVVVLLAVGGNLVWNRSPEDRARTLVQALLAARPDGVLGALDSLMARKVYALPQLQSAFTQAPDTSPNKLHAAFGLAALGEAPVPFLLDRVAEGPSGHALNLTRALAGQKARATDEIPHRIAQAETPEARARLATVALFLGDLAPLQGLTRTNANPTNRTAFIHTYPQWPGDPLQLATSLQAVSTNSGLADLRSALCAALALVEWKTLAAPEQAALVKTLRQLYTESPDGGTHSAAACALTRWGQALPEPPAPTNQPPAVRDWFVNGQGMTMLRIPAGTFRMGYAGSDTNFFSAQPVHSVTLSNSFFISDREVTVAQFRQFTNSVAHDPQTPPLERLTNWVGEYPSVSPATNCPVQQVTWFDAVKFSNWLSRQEGRTPCYTNSGTNWQCNLQANGYRLPTEAEWEYTCRAVSQSRYTFGDDEKLLGEYAWYSANSSSRTWPAGSKLPNLWGAFDLHGNVWEWCQDWFGPYTSGPVTNPPGPESGQYRVLRGGSWSNVSPAGLSSSSRSKGPPDDRYGNIGFRCVVGVVGSAPR